MGVISSRAKVTGLTLVHCHAPLVDGPAESLGMQWNLLVNAKVISVMVISVYLPLLVKFSLFSESFQSFSAVCILSTCLIR